MKKRISAYITGMMLCCISVNGFNTTVTRQEEALPSWESYDFIKYGKVGASLYTGTVNYSVPIYSYKDNDFDYSLSVDYATNGLKVNQDSGILGRGWSLSHPGMVTREVCGIVDEIAMSIGGDFNSGADLKGYLFVEEGTLEKCVLTDNDNSVYASLESSNSVNDKFYESTPDMYSFNFCGYNGSFHRLQPKNGKPCFRMYDLDSSSRGLSIKHLDERGSIVFADAKGYEYVFEDGEHTVGFIYDYLINDQKQGIVIRSWFLTEIRAPNGRTLKFVYDKDKPNYEKPIYNEKRRYYYSAILPYYYPIGQDTRQIIMEKTRMSQSRLSKILFPDGTSVSIEYENGAKEICVGNFLPSNYTYKRIKRIELSSNNRIFKEARFAYNVKQIAGDNPYTYLEKIDITGTGKFSFYYHYITGTPRLGTRCYDHWGYYNGHDGGFKSDRVDQNLIYDENYNESYDSTAIKEPNLSDAKSGALKRIEYPTGGYSELTYELHDCSKKVVRTSHNFFTPRLGSTEGNEKVGGIRIKRICTREDNSSPIDTVTYEYLDKEGKSSGILLNVPRYGICYSVMIANIHEYRFKTVNYYDLANSIHDYNRTHIEYSRVREYKSSAGYTDYYFSNYMDYPDEDNPEGTAAWRSGYYTWWMTDNLQSPIPVSFVQDDCITGFFKPIRSCQTKRGKLIKKQEFDQSGRLLNSHEFSYDFPLVAVDSIFSIVGEVAMNVLYPRYNIELSDKLDSVYSEGKSISQFEKYTYNERGEMSMKAIFSSDDYQTIERYYYVGDSTTTDGIVGKMREHNLFSYPLRQETCIEKGGKETLLGRKEYTYIQPNPANESLIKVGQVKEYSGTNSLKTVTEYEYDDLGYVRQQKSTDGVPTSYLWSYNGKFPVVKAGNVAFTALQSALAGKGLGVTALRDMADVDNSTFGKLLGIRSLLSASPVEVFKYDPTAGMTERTASNSLKTFYNYDRYARLISITDNNGETLEKRSYNIVTLKEDDDTTINGNNE